MITKVIVQVIDLDNSQRSEPFAVDVSEASEVLNQIEDWINSDGQEMRPNMGVLVVAQTDSLEGEEKLTISQAPIMKFDTFKQVMEQKQNER